MLRRVLKDINAEIDARRQTQLNHLSVIPPVILPEPTKEEDILPRFVVSDDAGSEDTASETGMELLPVYIECDTLEKEEGGYCK